MMGCHVASLCAGSKSPCAFEWRNDWGRTNSGDSGDPDDRQLVRLSFGPSAELYPARPEGRAARVWQ